MAAISWVNVGGPDITAKERGWYLVLGSYFNVKVYAGSGLEAVCLIASVGRDKTAGVNWARPILRVTKDEFWVNDVGIQPFDHLPKCPCSICTDGKLCETPASYPIPEVDPEEVPFDRRPALIGPEVDPMVDGAEAYQRTVDRLRALLPVELGGRFGRVDNRNGEVYIRQDPPVPPPAERNRIMPYEEFMQFDVLRGRDEAYIREAYAEYVQRIRVAVGGPRRP